MKARLYYFLIVSLLVLNLGPKLPDKGADAVAYLGAVLAALLLLCDESKLPHKSIVLCCAYVASYTWAAWKLVTDPLWVVYRRAGFVVLTRRSLLRSIRGLTSVEDLLTREGSLALTSLLELTETIQEDSGALLKAARAAGYWTRISIAIRILKLSSWVLPAVEMAEQIHFAREMRAGTHFPFPGMVLRVAASPPDKPADKPPPA